ncbi:uncharacterized protein [Nicotiana tomentosiformis]|uniref:uncharacterized protein n=1 Tax=Nicotiana tomentosiformis TaxID=4098 RepID=UPI00388C3496
MFKRQYEKRSYLNGIIETEEQIADIFTKALSKDHYERNLLELGTILWLFGDGRQAHAQKQQSRVMSSGRAGGGVGIGERVGGGTGPIGGKRNNGAYRLRIGSWNIGTLTGKSIELAKILQKRKVNIACVQETRWVGSKAKNADGYKLWYSGGVEGKNGVGILVDRDLRESVVEVRRVSDRLMAIKLVVGLITLNVISTYAPQVGLDEEVKSGYGEVHGGFGCWVKNGGGTSLLDFARAFELVIVNSIFPKKEEHLITFRSMVAKTQIDYLLLRRCDKGMCEDCKVIPSENLATQLRLLVMDIGILIKRKKRFVRGQPRIRWGALTKDTTLELEGKLAMMGAWKSSGDASGDWWWNDVVQSKVEAKKAAYLKLVESTNEEKMRANRERYKEARREAKVAVTEAKTTAFGQLTKRMPDEWRWSMMIPMYKNKGDIQNCNNYRGIKLLSHTMKVWGKGGGREGKEGGANIR